MLKPLKTEADYEAALQQLEPIFDAEPNTEEGDLAEILTMLVEKYEEKHYPMPPPDPIEAIKFRMEQYWYNVSDLAKVVGYSSRASEILKRKRKLTLWMIRNISSSLQIPTDILVQDYDLAVT